MRLLIMHGAFVFATAIMVGADQAQADVVCPKADGTIDATQKTMVDGATGNQTVCGDAAIATGAASVAVGHYATAVGNRSVVIGYYAGQNSTSRTENYIAIGQFAGKDANATSSIAIGSNAGQGVAASENVAIGASAGRNVGGLGVERTDITCVWGHGWWCQSLAGGGDGAANNAIGTNAGTGTRGMQNNAIGWSAGVNVQGNQNVALGTGAGRSIVGSGNVAIGGDWAGRNVIGDYNYAGGTGAGSYVTGVGNVALGHKAGRGTSTMPLMVSRSIAIGQAALAGTDSIAMGSGAQATGEQSIAIGTGNQVTGNHAGAIGDPNIVSGSGSYVLGNNNTIASGNSFVMGNDVTVASGLDGAVALGNGSTVAAAVPVANGTVAGVTHSYAGVADAAGDVVSVGAPGSERQVQNVAAGRVAADSTDAVNGSQLHATNTELAAVRTDLPGGWSGADIYALGQSGAGSNTVVMTNLAAGELSETSTDAVNGAQLHATDQELAALKAGAAAIVSDLADTRARLAGDWTAEGAYALDQAGAASGPVVMTNVAAGDVAATSADAVNGAQLHATNSELAALQDKTTANTASIGETRAQLPGRWSEDDSGTYMLRRSETDAAPVMISNLGRGRIAAGSTDAVTGGQLYDLSVQVTAQGDQIARNRREANRGIASAMALSMLRYDDHPAKLSIGFGLGNYRGATSMALGAGYISRDEKWRFSGGMTYGGSSDLGAAFGASYTFD
ncbi:MAG: YadA-like family protein [Paracoccus sp. (in: a-proteobacteria)]|uniref:YadA-like family protein n=1 Tax=Paracoccus sp. TaxID=267 RepID=UPI0026DEA3B1|nr:YadA-like family protein [Paracoccus sp. (in: a-proteobacteria)]MDO5632915.1 YadA-like family protein [Paracoccus sp. (in: a-proteobacteria)]